MKKHLFLFVLAIFTIMLFPTAVLAERGSESKFRISISSEFNSNVNDSSSVHVNSDDVSSKISESVSKISNYIENKVSEIRTRNTNSDSQDSVIIDDNSEKKVPVSTTLDVEKETNNIISSKFNFDASISNDSEDKPTLDYSVSGGKLNAHSEETSAIKTAIIKTNEDQTNMLNTYNNKVTTLFINSYSVGSNSKFNSRVFSGFSNETSGLLSIFDKDTLLVLSGSNKHDLSNISTYIDKLKNVCLISGKENLNYEYKDGDRASANYKFETTYGND